MNIDERLESIADQFGYDSEKWDIDSQEYALALLLLVEDFIRKYESKSDYYIEKYYARDMDNLISKLKRVQDKYFDKMCDNHFKTLAYSFRIPVNKLSIIPRKYNLKTTAEVIITSLENLGKHFKLDMDELFKVRKDSVFADIKPKLKNVIKKVKGIVEYGVRVGGEKSRRNVLNFVYEEDALYEWVSQGDSRVCAWCREQEALPPRKLDDIPIDHPFGRCVLKSVKPDAYSSEYKELVA